MNRFVSALIFTSWIAALALAAPPPTPKSDGAEKVDFQRHIRPILSENCFHCHGPDAATRQVGLRLDTREGLFAKRDHGTPIVPGDLEASLLYQRITSKDPEWRMPHHKKPLSRKRIYLIKRWIEEGATWSQQWSFQAPKRPELPEVNNEKWPRNEIDRFILARLEAEGLEPAPEADRRTLIRRVSLDLTGLPPTPKEVGAFVNDASKSAYEKLVGRLLESPRWGEHRARYWLDAARYADTHGLHIDNYHEMWPYRDWVINAFNKNMPFDQFTVEQIAGDLLPNPTLEQRIATGFQRCHITTNEGGVIRDEVAAMYARDEADTIGTVWLGLTLGCATCHNHKFDPVSQKDFYSMTAFFRNTTQPVMDGNVSDTPPIVIVPRDEDRARWAELKREAAETAGGMKRVASAADEKFKAWLAGGQYRSLNAPLDKSSELLTFSLGEGAQVRRQDRVDKIELPEGVTLGAGPEEGLPALHFADAGVELPNLEIDEENPFSITVWLYQPESDGNFVVASQSDPADNSRGWSIYIGARVPGFKVTGDKSKSESYTEKVEIRAGHLHQLEVGKWHHIAVTYDGSGERAGLNFYLNGEAIPTQGGEYFTKIKGSIRNDRPLLLGKQVYKKKDEQRERYFAGGAIADFRVFNREITVEEARLVSLWPVLERATRKQSSQLSEQEREALKLYYVSLEDNDYRQLVAEQHKLQLEQREIRRRGAITLVMQERTDSRPSAHILFRGMYDQPRAKVAANVPATLPPMLASFPRNRLGLAKWLVDDSNPLTARVTVNRFWQQVFGTGIVKTSDDFGAQGQLPSHPKLLDWLALEFRDSGWDVKDFFRLLVTSSAYRQSAVNTAEKIEKDPENRLISRGPRFRMDGEMVRDYALDASGLLVGAIGGPSVKPYQPDGIWESVAMPVSNTRYYKQDHGEKLYRRSLYTFWKRAAPPASMAVFNAPTREYCTVRRERTDTPLQALVTMNDPQFVEASRYLAQKALREAPDDWDRQLDYMTTRLLARKFEENERAVAKRTYNDFLSYYGSNTKDARNLLLTGASKPDESLPPAQSAALTMLAGQIMNLDEVLNK